MAEEERITVTAKARAIYAQYKTATDERQQANLACSLHGACGLYPWSSISVSDVVGYFDEQSRTNGR